MAAIAPFSEGQIEQLARILGECGTGDAISRNLKERGLQDHSGESTKWRRLHWVFTDCQVQHRCANRILDFIRSYLDPSRFLNRADEFEERRAQLNAVLSFSGLEYGGDGEFRAVSKARTLDEAEQRLRTLRSKLNGRVIHPEVTKYCRTELLQENYFHAVFEATKGLAQRVRELSGADGDGAKLVDDTFLGRSPLLALNFLKTETEWSEQRGFAALLKGCFAAIRNPLAHEPKILWQGEDDAADYLTLVSLMHRKLDRCCRTRGQGLHNGKTTDSNLP